MPVLDTHSMEFISRSVEQTRRLGMRLGSLLRTGDLVCLVGELGSGKTALVQGITAGWGSLDQATSPTYVLVNIYRHPQKLRLFHLDAYRLSSNLEAEELDIDGMLEYGVLLIEWAERIQEVLPGDRLWVNFYQVSEDQRDMVFTARGDRSQETLSVLRQQLYGAVS